MARIFTKLGKGVVNNIPGDAYDTIFDKTRIVDRPVNPNDIDTTFDKTTAAQRYDNSIYSSVSSVNSGQGIMDVYYKTYGYTSLIGDAASYLIGTKDASHLLLSGLSTLVPGVTNNSIGSFILHTANMALRSPFISNIVNTFLPSPFNILDNSVIKWQHIPSQLYLTTHPPPSYQVNGEGDGILDIIGNAAASVLASTVSGLSNAGSLTSFDWDRAFGKGLKTAEIIMMSQAGLKYTEAVAFFDTTRPTWANDPSMYTYDRYIGYSDGQITYPKSAGRYNDTMIDRYNSKFGAGTKPDNLAALANEPAKALQNPPTPSDLTNAITSGVSDISTKFLGNGTDNAKAYQAALGGQPDPNREPEKMYLNRPDSRESGKTVGQIVQRLGFPLVGTRDSQRPGDWNDAINIQDLIEDEYSYENSNQRDIIDFRFEDISSIGRLNPITILFRAAITGLTDDWSPEWSDVKYLGRPDTFYTYSGYARKISFDMKVYCNSKNEVVPQWRKLNRLAGMCYPVSYAGNRAMKAPIMRLTIGNMYRRIYGFLDSFGISIPDEALWDTDLGYQLPMTLDAKIGFTIMYEADGQGAPQTNAPHFNQDKLFPSLANDGTGEKIYGDRYEDKIDKTKKEGIANETDALSAKDLNTNPLGTPSLNVPKTMNTVSVPSNPYGG